ncbi:tRNA lysidine(34) synthetase TilS [Hydrogenimonas cancrithermarum]|uniref:tRNA(Ile)-lysidine synthase n=1 Tax=Hydrogenimonas cancrithermarum TaxID=2993563 RepID=A0ABM8FLX1_9BACT|nr:tRNA lysidine(34) synthetase TilS [Hydrogenimonas cancrithermarum]BDY12703.1 tRNA(Ile)-lysidine synthase [Hydrogenimonas cancrithermarum]
MLEPEALDRLERGKNLLAFSAGIDSTALYHLLKAEKIPFDIALVNYKTRGQSDEEQAYAEKLAALDRKRAFTLVQPLSGGDFERQARSVRYAFFEKLMEEHGYDNLITAHQLDDLLEWGLMQLCKGCGVAEFVGMQPVEKRRHYTLVRPLLFTPKQRLLSYLKEHAIRYFIDESNIDTRFRRNRFRQEAAAFLMRECSDGIARSFRYMLEDKGALLPEPAILFRHHALTLLTRPFEDTQAIRQIDRVLKENGYILSKAQKDEILEKKSVVVGGKWVVELESERIWIAPRREAMMPKPFKERCRVAKIPKKVRPYLFETDGLDALLSFFSS